MPKSLVGSGGWSVDVWHSKPARNLHKLCFQCPMLVSELCQTSANRYIAIQYIRRNECCDAINIFISHEIRFASLRSLQRSTTRGYRRPSPARSSIGMSAYPRMRHLPFRQTFSGSVSDSNALRSAPLRCIIYGVSFCFCPSRQPGVKQVALRRKSELSRQVAMQCQPMRSKTHPLVVRSMDTGQK